MQELELVIDQTTVQVVEPVELLLQDLVQKQTFLVEQMMAAQEFIRTYYLLDISGPAAAAVRQALMTEIVTYGLAAMAAKVVVVAVLLVLD